MFVSLNILFWDALIADLLFKIHASEPDSDPTTPSPTYLPLVISNATLAIIAGSDTTSTVLSNILSYLIAHPEYMKKLRAEIDENFHLGDMVHGTSAIELSKLGSMKILNAIMYVVFSEAEYFIGSLP